MSKKRVDKNHSPAKEISQKIFFVRGEKVMFDFDLARVYGVTTSRLNEQIKRNAKKFPEDFMFRLTRPEFDRLMSQVATSKRGRGGRRKLPLVFTEHGALMAASVLNSKRAVAMSVYVIRAFVRLREVFLDNQILQERLREIEELLLEHDVALEDVHEKIAQLFLLSRKPGAIDFDSGNGNGK